MKDLIVGKSSEVVQNEFSGEKATLTPNAVAIYDLIKGAERFGSYKIMRVGLDWFRKYHPNEYMILLD